MKHSLFLTLLPLLALPALADTRNIHFDVNAGTQGLGLSLGYKVNPSVRLRLRGAMMGYDTTENWSDMQSQLKLYGNNVGMLVDIFPGEGNFYISAGLNFSESKMRCRARHYTQPGRASNFEFGGVEYRHLRGPYAEVTGKYSWNHAQPYIGIGYQDSLFGSSTFYYSVDLGINFMGSGSLTVSNSGNMEFKDPATNQWKPAENQMIEDAVRQEGRDFFKIADDLYVYPVLQLGLGVRF